MQPQNKHFEEKLLAEKSLLEEELGRVGRKNPENPSDWEPVMSDLNIPEADWNERADQLENFGEHNAIEVELEEQLSLVNTAIEKIRAGNYGICITCKGEIERDRLEANPSAQTCKTCMK